MKITGGLVDWDTGDRIFTMHIGDVLLDEIEKQFFFGKQELPHAVLILISALIKQYEFVKDQE